MLDFKEIANSDDWELFARDFLKIMGFKIINDPARGADGGKDLIIEEHLNGITTKEVKRWLVSCKHNAVSGASVNCAKENNITDRLARHNCDGFLGFYSTLASSDLQSCLEGIRENQGKKYEIYDHRKIEDIILKQKSDDLIKRYFPDYYKQNTKPINKITDSYIPLKCESCGKDLLKQDEYSGIVVYLSKIRETDEDYEQPEFIENIYFACKGSCDRKLERKISNNNLIDTWEDLTDLEIPYMYLNTVFRIIKDLNNSKIKFSDKALNKFFDLIIAISQKVFRKTTEQETQRLLGLLRLPDYF